MAEKNIELKVPDYLREPLEAAQARLAVFEKELEKRLKDLAREWAPLADRLLKELAGLRARVVGAMGIASRDQLDEMSKDLARLARQLDRAAKPAKPGSARNGAKKATLEA